MKDDIGNKNSINNRNNMIYFSFAEPCKNDINIKDKNNLDKWAVDPFLPFLSL